MKLQFEVDGRPFALDLPYPDASVEETMPGIVSVLLGNRSFQVFLAPDPAGTLAQCGARRYLVAPINLRDQTINHQRQNSGGPVEVRAQMPGKIIKILAPENSSVAAGQGVIVVEAMKMQNEVKAPKEGVVSRVHAHEGDTVTAGQPLFLVS